MKVNYLDFYLFDDVPLEVKLPGYEMSINPWRIDPGYEHWTKKGQKNINTWLSGFSIDFINERYSWIIMAQWNTGNWAVGRYAFEPKVVN